MKMTTNNDTGDTFAGRNMSMEGNLDSSIAEIEDILKPEARPDEQRKKAETALQFLKCLKQGFKDGVLTERAA